MSTSLLYHAFGIQGYVYVRTGYLQGEVHVTVRQPDRKLRCSACGSRRIAIDEISIERGHRYLTVVLDLDTGAVVFVGEGKGADALEPFWTRFCRSKARIEAVATDMSHAYIRAVRDHVPHATLVFDRFHVMKLMNDKLSDLRRQLQREAEAQQKDVLKGTRWLLLKNPGRLDRARKEMERLEEALKLNAPLAAGYYLKEDLQRFWNQPNKDEAARLLQDWIDRARATGIKQLRQMAHTLSIHRAGLLANHDIPITSGPLEGTNTKIQLLKRQAYGYRDREFFKLRIYALHATRLALVR
jgi:transposase